MIVKNKSKYRYLERFFIIALTILLLFAFSCLILVLCCNNNITYYYAGTISAAIAVGLIPLLVFVDNLLKKKDEEKFKERVATSKHLKMFGSIMAESENSFTQAVISKFCLRLNLKRFFNDFYSLNHNTVINNMETAITASNKSWSCVLEDIIDELIKLPDFKGLSLEGFNKQGKLDFFFSKLLHLFNLYETLAYDFLNLNVNFDTFMEEESKIIVNDYFQAYFILFKGNSSNSFPLVDAMCNVIFCGGKQK